MLEFINFLAGQAGKKSLEYFGNLNASDVSGKATAKDLVSIADKAVEDFLISEITKRFPDHDIFGEETGHAGKNSEFCWIIDPIDGTQSFVKNHPYYSISIAIYRNGEGFAGAVNAPALGRCFTAQRGCGAFMNGSPIHISACRDLAEADCSTGFARLREGAGKVEPVLETFSRIVPNVRSIFRCGSAALDMAFTAAGIYDCYWEEGLQLYDIAAGAVIAQEAGGIVCDFHRGNDFPASGVVCGNAEIVRQMCDLLA